jgi:hypothetical protein
MRWFPTRPTEPVWENEHFYRHFLRCKVRPAHGPTPAYLSSWTIRTQVLQWNSRSRTLISLWVNWMNVSAPTMLCVIEPNILWRLWPFAKQRLVNSFLQQWIHTSLASTVRVPCIPKRDSHRLRSNGQERNNINYWERCSLFGSRKVKKGSWFVN